MHLMKKLGLATLIAIPASTVDAGLLEILRDNGSINAEQYTELKKEQAEEIKTVGGSKLQFKGPDYKYTIAGRFYQDFAHYQEDITPLDSGSELRTARLEAKGQFYGNWKFKTQYGFHNDKVDSRYIWLGYQFENSILKVGRMYESNGMESNASSRYITFMERGTPVTAFEASDWGEGVEYRWWNDNSQFTVSGLLETDPDDDQFRWHGRYSIAPVNEPGNIIHLGAWANHLSPPSETSGASSRFETHIDGKLLKTSVSNVDKQLTSGLEFAWVGGPLSFQAEYMNRDISVNSGSDVSLDGYYAHISYFLTGESRSYYHDYGSFDRIKPQGKNGAVQLALRVSELDFTDNSDGKMSNITIGVNWWPKKNIKFAFNQVFSSVEKRNNTITTADEDVGVTQVRAQIDF